MATIAPIKNSKKGAYRITVSNGYDSNNKQIRVTTTFTPDKTKSKKMQEKQVQEFAFEFERKVKTGKLYSGDKISFANFVKEWLEKEAPNILEQTTLYSYEGKLNTVIVPALGKYKMTKITTVLLEEFYNSLTKENARFDGKGRYKHASILVFHKIICSVMRTALRWKVIDENPCKGVVLPKNEDKGATLKYFTLEQAQVFLEQLDKPYKVKFNGHKITVPTGKVIALPTYIKERTLPLQYKVFYRLCLFCGFRKGELIALKWENVDFENNMIYVEKSVGYTKAGISEKQPKSKASATGVPVPSSEMDLLAKLKTEQQSFMFSVGDKWEGYRGKQYNQNHVFVQQETNYGKMLHPSTPSRKMVTLINYYNEYVEDESKKLPQITLHGLRHTCATLNIAMGTDVKTVQGLLRHARSQTTLDIYAHPLEAKKKEATEALSNLFSKEA